jgi:hypothetical protein
LWPLSRSSCGASRDCDETEFRDVGVAGGVASIQPLPAFPDDVGTLHVRSRARCPRNESRDRFAGLEAEFCRDDLGAEAASRECVFDVGGRVAVATVRTELVPASPQSFSTVKTSTRRDGARRWRLRRPCRAGRGHLVGRAHGVPVVRSRRPRSDVLPRDWETSLCALAPACVHRGGARPST